jgi:hypothetical protein
LRIGLDRKFAANLVSPLSHTRNAEMSVGQRFRMFEIETCAVIGNLQDEAFRLILESYRDHGGTGVFDDIGNRFLRNAENLRSNLI